jgi:hypothetical protein
MKKYQFALTVLDRALTTKRPDGNVSTAKFCEWLRRLLPSNNFVDAVGNIHVDIRHGVSTSLFVAHVDTVHYKGGKNKVIKTDKKWSANGAPLGADDGAGVALLMHMINAQVPGYYVFTQGEECGGIGAKWLAKNMPGLLAQFKRAIAFDRRATYSVITHQGWGRCASDEFGEALADAFNKRDMLFMTDDTGVYTDTAEFVDIIPECTNISVGYDMEHSDRETLDMDHFLQLCKVVLKIDWEALPAVRDPKVIDDSNIWSKYSSPRRKSKKGVSSIHSLGGLDALSGWPADWADDLTSRVDEGEPFAWSDLTDLDYETADKNIDLMMAIDEAFDGKLNKLVDIIAKNVSPDSPGIAARQISRRRITLELLAEMLQDAQVVDTDTLLMTVFDQVGDSVWS